MAAGKGPNSRRLDVRRSRVGCDQMAHAALGTDTGGSCRIPAAFCGLVGFKPTARRVPLAGTIPLSFSLDSVGPIARSVECCALLDSILSSEAMPDLATGKITGSRLGVLRTVVQDGMDEHVSAAMERVLSQLSKAGAYVEDIAIAEFSEIAGINAKGGFPAAEGFSWHQRLIDNHADLYDPRVLSRIRRGAQQTATDYIELVAARHALIVAVSDQIAKFDALVFPTVPIVPPLISELETDEAFTRLNLLVLRNSTIVNMIDGCAISIPVHRPGEGPVGLTLAGQDGDDRQLLHRAEAVERCLME